MSETLLVTVLVHSRVQGPSGLRLSVGQIVKLEDCPYVRLLIKSGNVELIDPPSLEPEFLGAIGYVFAQPKEEGTLQKTLPQKAPVKDLFPLLPPKREKKGSEVTSRVNSKDTGTEEQ